MRKSKKQELEIMQSIADSFKESQKSNEEVSKNIKEAIDTINETRKIEQKENRDFLSNILKDSNTNTESMTNLIKNIFPTTESPEESDDDEKKALLAAYTLNLCTVSVSQIIDYNDIVILEQEYEAILNNLNLENIPKDEALLNTLKQILDVITFFRIQEGDKKFIEKEYKAKMKNAIWSAVPNLSVVLATPNPYVMAATLATQIGIGYMNYRKNKAEYSLDKEKQEWQLQRSAIEQFNGLRRELFDTSWRLADSYDFKDEYRLTERQIKQYNEILLDNNEYRKYERLKLVENKFQAYPNFYYFLGNAANSVTINSKKYNYIEDKDRETLREEAKSYYEKYYQFIKSNNILREDQIASACALEYIELLDVENEKEKVNELLHFAIEKCGNALDVIQLCAITYFRIKDYIHAEELFKKLVNEGYNVLTNAQLLSGIYVALKQQGDDVDMKYKLLTTIVPQQYLYKLPDKKLSLEESHKSQNEFNIQRINYISKRFTTAINEFIDKQRIEFNKCVPTPDSSYHEDSYYVNCSSQRNKDINKVLSNNRAGRKYRKTLYDSNFVYNWFEVINRTCESLLMLEPITKCNDSEIKKSIKGETNSKENILKNYENLCESDTEVEEVKQLLRLTLDTFMSSIFSFIRNSASDAFDKLKNSDDINNKVNKINTILDKFCDKEKITVPEIIIQDYQIKNNEQRLFDITDAIEEIIVNQRENRDRMNRINTMIDLINNVKEILIKDHNKMHIEITNPIKIDANDCIIATISAIDKEKKRPKLKLTEEGVIFVKNGILGKDRNNSYSSIKSTSKINEIKGTDGKVELDGINIDVLTALASKLADV